MGQTINLASKYSAKVAERFRETSFTDGAFNQDYEFTGVKTVKLYSVNVAPLGDYTRSGTSRYGTPEDLGDTVQELVMGQDKSFTFIIDKGNAGEQMNTKAAGRALRREIDEIINPYVDQYRLQVWSSQAGKIAGVAAPTRETIVSQIMDGVLYLDNHLVPADGRELRIAASYYKLLKTCADFSPMDKVSEKAIVKGQVGEIDGMRVVKIPDSYMPPNVYFLITHKSACLSPMKLQDYKVHKDPPGISGDLAEGRIIFDAFVLGARCDGIYAAVAEDGVTAEVTFTPATGGSITAGTTKLVMSCSTGSSAIYYTLDGTDPRFSSTAKLYSEGATGIATTGWSGTVTVRAYAKAPSLFRSGPTEGTYTI